MDPLLKILVVDDMPAMRSIVGSMLEELGYIRIFQAEDGEAAWRLIKASQVEPFGLIVADWNMPGMSGVDLLRAVRSFSATRTLPFLMVTAKNQQADIAEALGAGASGYMVKPFSAMGLGARLDELFGV